MDTVDEKSERVREASDNLKDKAQDLANDLIELAVLYYRLGVLRMTDKATGFTANSVIITMLIVLTLFGLLFISLGAAWWLGSKLDSMPGGFAIVAGFYLLLAGLVLALRKPVIIPALRNFMIRKLYASRTQSQSPSQS